MSLYNSNIPSFKALVRKSHFTKNIEDKEEEFKTIDHKMYIIKKRIDKKTQEKETLPVIVFAVQMQSLAPLS